MALCQSLRSTALRIDGKLLIYTLHGPSDYTWFRFRYRYFFNVPSLIVVHYIFFRMWTITSVASRRLNWRSCQAVSFPSLFLASPPLFSHTLPFPLEVGPYNAARRLNLPQRGLGLQQKQFWHIWSPGKASGGKDLGSSVDWMLFLLHRFLFWWIKGRVKARPGPMDATPLDYVRNRRECCRIHASLVDQGHSKGSWLFDKIHTMSDSWKWQNWQTKMLLIKTFSMLSYPWSTLGYVKQFLKHWGSCTRPIHCRQTFCQKCNIINEQQNSCKKF